MIKIFCNGNEKSRISPKSTFTCSLKNLVLALTAVSLLALSACGGGGSGQPLATCLNSSDPLASTMIQTDVSNSRISITNNDTALDKLITCKSTDIAIAATSKPSKPGAAVGGQLNKGKKFKLKLVAEALPPTIVGKAVGVPYGVTGELMSGGTYSGTYTALDVKNYRVQIDTAATPDTFSWSDDGTTTWIATGVPIDGTAQTLNKGVTVTFTATTGHTVGDYWIFDAGVLQTTSVSMIKDKKAVVSYNMVGNPFLGAIQVYELKDTTALLKSQALFNDMDINAVSVSNKSDVFAVGAHEPALKASVLDWLTLNKSKLQIPTPPVGITLPIELHSFAANSVIHDTTNNKIYVTDGNTGGLTVVDDTTLVEDSHTALADARWVEMEGTTAVVMQGGNATGVNGQISVYDITGGVPSFTNSFPFTGADIIQSKSTVEVFGGKAFLGAGSGGAVVMSASTGSLLATIPIPTAADSGITDPNLRVANAVSIDDDLMFISFGEAGVYVAQETSGKKFNEISSEGPVAVSLLGKLQFGSLQSVNHVAHKGKFLFVAAGIGGLKIVKIEGL